MLLALQFNDVNHVPVAATPPVRVTAVPRLHPDLIALSDLLSSSTPLEPALWRPLLGRGPRYESHGRAQIVRRMRPARRDRRPAVAAHPEGEPGSSSVRSDLVDASMRVTRGEAIWLVSVPDAVSVRTCRPPRALASRLRPMAASAHAASRHRGHSAHRRR